MGKVLILGLNPKKGKRKRIEKYKDIGDIYEFLGKNIRTLRKKFNLTIEELANCAGIDSSFLGNIERGKKKPTLYTLEKIAEVFDTTPHNLFNEQFIQNLKENTIYIKNILRLVKNKPLKDKIKIYKLIKKLKNI